VGPGGPGRPGDPLGPPTQSGGEENSSTSLEFEHIPHLFFSSVLPSSQVLSIHAYLLFPEVLWKFIFL